eukprot:2915279-Rhodomonas_salina.1
MLRAERAKAKAAAKANASVRRKRTRVCERQDTETLAARSEPALTQVVSTCLTRPTDTTRQRGPISIAGT